MCLEFYRCSYVRAWKNDSKFRFEERRKFYGREESIFATSASQVTTSRSRGHVSPQGREVFGSSYRSSILARLAQLSGELCRSSFCHRSKILECAARTLARPLRSVLAWQSRRLSTRPATQHLWKIHENTKQAFDNRFFSNCNRNCRGSRNASKLYRDFLRWSFYARVITSLWDIRFSKEGARVSKRLQFSRSRNIRLVNKLPRGKGKRERKMIGRGKLQDDNLIFLSFLSGITTCKTNDVTICLSHERSIGAKLGKYTLRETGFFEKPFLRTTIHRVSHVKKWHRLLCQQK